MGNIVEPISEDKSQQETPFAHKYAEEFRALKETDVKHRSKELIDARVDTVTPSGKVRLKLAEIEPGKFKFWADKNNIVYSHLETAARIFCIDNNCKTLCIDTPNEIFKAQQRRRDSATIESHDCVFAKTKVYNGGRGGTVLAKSKMPCPEKANQFKYMGPVEKEHLPKVVTPFTYNQWKTENSK
tara:strand:- start:33852 stop:34406 length:555 start_codon:yes stop_codon:yes gene_type:complete